MRVQDYSYEVTVDKPGMYNCAIFLAEIDAAMTGPGVRLFDVEVQGQELMVVKNIDIFKEVGKYRPLTIQFNTLNVAKTITIRASATVNVAVISGFIIYHASDSERCVFPNILPNCVVNAKLKPNSEAESDSEPETPVRPGPGGPGPGGQGPDPGPDPGSLPRPVPPPVLPPFSNVPPCCGSRQTLTLGAGYGEQVEFQEDVRQMQALLNKSGGYGIPEDGLFGRNTDAKVRAWHSKNNLSVDGVTVQTHGQSSVYLKMLQSLLRLNPRLLQQTISLHVAHGVSHLLRVLATGLLLT